MSTMRVELELQYDMSGQIMGYTIENMAVIQRVDISTLDGSQQPQAAEAVALTKLCSALNEGFGLPPIPGMSE